MFCFNRRCLLMLATHLLPFLNIDVHLGGLKKQSLLLRNPLNKDSKQLRELLTSSTQDTSISFVNDGKIGVLLLNLGSPETLDDVQPFLFNPIADPSFIR